MDTTAWSRVRRGVRRAVTAVRARAGRGGGAWPAEHVQAAVAAAEQAMAAGDWSGAVQQWRVAIEAAGDAAPSRAHRRLAVAHREAGNLDAAEAVLDAARGSNPTAEDVAVEWAKLPMFEQDWDRAAERWLAVVTDLGDDAPVSAFLGLAEARGHLGDHAGAGAALRRGRTLHPASSRLAMVWAAAPEQVGDWNEAAVRWRAVLQDDSGAPGDEVVVALVRCLWRLGRTEEVPALLHQGLREHPDSVALRTAQVRDGVRRRAWQEVVDRARALLDGDGLPDGGEVVLPPEVHRDLAVAHRELEELDEAAAVLERAAAVHPGDVVLQLERAQLAMARGAWDRVVDLWRDATTRRPEACPARVWARLATELRHRGQYDDAAEVLATGRAHHPDAHELRFGEAHVAMARGAWRDALEAWQAEVHVDPVAGTAAAVALPPAATNMDWDERSWRCLAEWLLEQSVATAAVAGVSAATHRALAAVLDRSGEPTLAEAVLRRAGHLHADDAGVAFDLACRGIGTAPTSEDLDRRVTDVVIGSDEALPRLHVLTVPRGSAMHLQVRRGRHVTEEWARAEAARLAERDDWPEILPGPNPVLARARRLADAFGERYARLPELSAGALADAVLLHVYTELWAAEPMRRVAAELASVDDDRPVYVDLPGHALHHLHGNTGDSELAPIHLVTELVRHGRTAVLVRVVDRDDPEVGPITSAPSPSLLAAPEPSRASAPEAADVAVVAAGMRAPALALEADRPLLYASGFRTQRFAYDRTLRTRVDLTPDLRVHPPRTRLPTLTFPLTQLVAVPTTDLVEAPGAELVGALAVSEPIGRDWLELLHRAVGPALHELSRTFHAEVRLRGITEARIADIHYPESALLAAAVREGGGRVELWPHSANPAHLEVRRADSFDAVHAVTRTGVEAWRAAFPHAEVVHTPSAMLSPLDVDVALDADRPLTLVLIGGKATQGHMPMLPPNAHAASTRRFLEGVQRLQVDHRIDVVYKPKGAHGENEVWLERVAGRTAGWRSVHTHPLRLQLPNMLFVAVSVGSSALLEGMGRGIPAIVVRDFPVRDYTTIDPEVVPTGPTDEVLAVVARCADGGLAALAAEQADYYRAETGG